jgi:hypothetical protein
MEPTGLLPHSQEPAPRDDCERFIKWQFLGWVVVITSSKPPMEDRPLSAVHDSLFNIFAATPYWRPFLHPQPEEASCRGDRDPRIMDWKPTHFFPRVLYKVRVCCPKPLVVFRINVFCHFFLCQYLPAHDVCCCSQAIRSNTDIIGLVESVTERNLGATSRGQRKCS